MTATLDERAEALAALASEAAACERCRLSETRATVVFGSGGVEAEVMFVGEGPGQREDEQGLPFVGPSGAFLEVLLGEIGLTRSDVYIGNVVKCRPPGNRDPRPDEIEACKGYLRSQVRLVDPAVVVTLGNFACKLLLPTDVGITNVRGEAYRWWGRHLVPTFHPAAALRGKTSVREAMQTDFAIVRSILDGNLEPRGDAAAAGSNGVQSPQPTASEVDQLDLFGN